MSSKKTSIYLDRDLDFALARQAERDGITKAELIRSALRGAVEDGGKQKPLASGAFDGPADLAERADEHLGAGFGE